MLGAVPPVSRFPPEPHWQALLRPLLPPLLLLLLTPPPASYMVKRAASGPRAPAPSPHHPAAPHPRRSFIQISANPHSHLPPTPPPHPMQSEAERARLAKIPGMLNASDMGDDGANSD